MPSLCRDCQFLFRPILLKSRCIKCSSPRLITHAELNSLSIAHIDCDSFYASIEKRDNPELKNKPVIVGGGTRGVVAACCYISRIRGVHSAMPMYKALEACPDAVVVSPNMEKYKAVSLEIKCLMHDTTPIIESLSIDEAFLDLAGTEKLHGCSPAKTLVKLIKRIEEKSGITVSVGLSYNKFLAKTASDIDKPRGFTVIGKGDALDFLSTRTVGSIWGIGKSMQNRLEHDGIFTINQLRVIPENDLTKRYGVIGKHLSELSQGIDSRPIRPGRKAKSISTEITFSRNVSSLNELLQKLWPLCEKISNQLKNKNLVAGTITIKLKTSTFQLVTRSHTLRRPTQLAERIYQEAKILLEPESNKAFYRLIGIGITQLSTNKEADQLELINISTEEIGKIESTIDLVRKKFGNDAIHKGRTFLKDKS